MSTRNVVCVFFSLSFSVHVSPGNMVGAVLLAVWNKCTCQGMVTFAGFLSSLGSISTAVSFPMPPSIHPSIHHIASFSFLDRTCRFISTLMFHTFNSFLRRCILFAGDESLILKLQWWSSLVAKKPWRPRRCYSTAGSRGGRRRLG